MVTEWVHDLRGKEVVFTGKIEGYGEEELAGIARKLGARDVKEWISISTTDVLVRGHSDRWKYGDFGKKEKQTAAMQSTGHHIQIIDAEGFFGLRSSIPAPALTPNVPGAFARADAKYGGLVGAPYRSASVTAPLQGDGEYYRDPDVMGRGLRAHAATQDALAELIDLQGLTPLSSFDRQCNFDLAWEITNESIGIAEVKSITDTNEASQIRLGLGQVLDYGHRMKARGFTPHLFLVLERPPRNENHWKQLCSTHSVTLTWAPSFRSVIWQGREYR